MHYEDQKSLYQVRGPLGKGLSINRQGKHIAYTAGTGVLVFMDLVAHLLVRLVEAANGNHRILSYGAGDKQESGSEIGENTVGLNLKT